jgi:hypothetical protein
MRVVRLTTVAALVAFGAALVLEGGALSSAGEKGAGKAARLVLGKVRVSDTTKDGKAWDINNGKPDLVVRIKNLSDKTTKDWVSEEKADTFDAEYNVAAILVAPGQELQIEVVDKDLAIEDLIGRKNLKVTEAMFSKDGMDIGPFDQVKMLTLSFRKP